MQGAIPVTFRPERDGLRFILNGKDHVFQCITKLRMMDHKMDGWGFVFGYHAPFFFMTGDLDVVKAFHSGEAEIVMLLPGGIFPCGCDAVFIFLKGKHNIPLKEALCHRQRHWISLIFYAGNL